MGRRRDGSVQREWRDRLKRYRGGTWTVAAFCDVEGVSVASFYAWRRRLEVSASRTVSTRHEGQAASAHEPANRPLFVPVSMALSAEPVRIELSSGTVVCVPASAEEALVRTWLRAALELERDAEASRC